MINARAIALENQVYKHICTLPEFTSLQNRYEQNRKPFLSAVLRAITIAIENVFTEIIEELAQMALDTLEQWLKELH